MQRQHAHERYTVFALHNCTHYYYESQGNEHQTIPHNHFEDMEWHIRLVLEGEDRLVRNLEARESETFSYGVSVFQRSGSRPIQLLPCAESTGQGDLFQKMSGDAKLLMLCCWIV